MVISYRRKTNWGRPDIYICDKQQAHIVSTMTRRATLNTSDIWALKELGHTLVDEDTKMASIVR